MTDRGITRSASIWCVPLRPMWVSTVIYYFDHFFVLYERVQVCITVSYSTTIYVKEFVVVTTYKLAEVEGMFFVYPTGQKYTWELNFTSCLSLHVLHIKVFWEFCYLQIRINYYPCESVGLLGCQIRVTSEKFGDMNAAYVCEWCHGSFVVLDLGSLLLERSQCLVEYIIGLPCLSHSSPRGHLVSLTMTSAGHCGTSLLRCLTEFSISSAWAWTWR